MVDCDPWYLSFPEKLGPSVVGILALVFTYRLALRQIRATTVSSSRQRWIDSLQDVLADLFPGQLAVILGQEIREQEDLLKAIDDYARFDTRLKLMLNPTDPDHGELAKGVEELGKNLWSILEKNGSKEYKAARERVLIAARKVIANEWSKIKRGA